jgi:L-fuculose-phosphate aldolase
MPAGTLTTLRRDVALACHILADDGQGDTVFGHVSARDPAGRGFWMKPAGRGLEEVRPSDLLLVGLDGTVLEGRHSRHVEYPIHAEVYRARPEVQAVVHTHPSHATAFAALRVPLRPVSHEACLFVPPDVPRFTKTTDLILTESLGGAVARALGPAWALLLESHGIVTAGERVGDACIRALLLEKAARIQLLAAGREATWTSEAEAIRKREHIYHPRALHSVWSYLVRRRERRRR